MTVAGLVEFALGLIGVPVVTHLQQSPELVRAIPASRIKRALLLRRGVSINRLNYEAAKKEAAGRGMTIAGLVEFALGTIPIFAYLRRGILVVAPPQQSLELMGLRVQGSNARCLPMTGTGTGTGS